MSDPETLVNALSEKLGIGKTTFNDGLGAIQFDEHIMNFHADRERDELRCFLRVASIPADPESRLALYRWLLIANSFGQGTGGGQLGIDEAETFVTFARIIPAGDLSAERLEIIVEIMLDMADGFQREWAALAPAGGSASSASPGSHGLRA